MKKIVILFACVVLAFAFLYFSYFDRPVALSGDEIWKGSWVSEKTGAQGAFEAVLLMENTALAGTIKIMNSPLTKGGDIKGTINGDKIEFGLAKDTKGLLKYEGQITKDSMSGIWEIPIVKERGTWQAAKEKKL